MLRRYKERAYKIPTYDVLFERQVNKIDDNWIYVWDVRHLGSHMGMWEEWTWCCGSNIANDTVVRAALWEG